LADLRKIEELREVVAHLGKVVDLISKDRGADQSSGAQRYHRGGAPGGHGRGFAVVASEVKSLSRQTSDSTDTIRKQIDTLGAAFSQVIDSVAKFGDGGRYRGESCGKCRPALRAINHNATSISEKVTELAEIISQQSSRSGSCRSNMSVVKDRATTIWMRSRTSPISPDRTVQLVENWRAELAPRTSKTRSSTLPSRPTCSGRSGYSTWRWAAPT